MNIYVESNFVLELTFAQEQYRSCEDILTLCELPEIKLVVPAYSLGEVHEKLARQDNNRRQLQDALNKEIRQLRRTTQYTARVARIHDIATLLVQSSEEEKQRFARYRNHIINIAEIIPLTSNTLRRAAAYEAPYNLTPQDALVYASVITHIEQNAPSESCFLNKNTKDFDNPDIEEELARKNCKMIPKFDQGYEFVQSRLKPKGAVTQVNPSYTDVDYLTAHKHSIENYAEIMASSVCGCFYCLAIFPPSDIINWHQENLANVPNIRLMGQTALCPKCGIDSVVGSSSGYPIAREFLQLMHDYWF